MGYELKEVSGEAQLEIPTRPGDAFLLITIVVNEDGKTYHVTRGGQAPSLDQAMILMRMLAMEQERVVELIHNGLIARFNDMPLTKQSIPGVL